jgi:hypothetical protein
VVEQIRHAFEDAIERDIFLSYLEPGLDWVLAIVRPCITYGYTVTSDDGPIQICHPSERIDSTRSSDDAMNE